MQRFSTPLEVDDPFRGIGYQILGHQKEKKIEEAGWGEEMDQQERAGGADYGVNVIKLYYIHV